MSFAEDRPKERSHRPFSRFRADCFGEMVLPIQVGFWPESSRIISLYASVLAMLWVRQNNCFPSKINCPQERKQISALVPYQTLPDVAGSFAKVFIGPERRSMFSGWPTTRRLEQWIETWSSVGKTGIFFAGYLSNILRSFALCCFLGRPSLCTL